MLVIDPKHLDDVGVRDLVARGYFIPGGASQRGCGQAPMFQCRTLSDLDYPGLRSVTCDVSSRWVLTTVLEYSNFSNRPYPPCTESRYNLNGHSHLASYNKTKKYVMFCGMSVLAQKKMCDYQRSSEHVVTRRDFMASPRALRVSSGPHG